MRIDFRNEFSKNLDEYPGNGKQHEHANNVSDDQLLFLGYTGLGEPHS
jgi:hypothetical protein